MITSFEFNNSPFDVIHGLSSSSVRLLSRLEHLWFVIVHVESRACLYRSGRLGQRKRLVARLFNHLVNRSPSFKVFLAMLLRRLERPILLLTRNMQRHLSLTNVKFTLIVVFHLLKSRSIEVPILV